MPTSDIYVRIGAKLDGLQRGIAKSQSQLRRFADFAERTGSTLTTRISAPLALVSAAAVKTFASFEKTKLGLTALYEEADVADKVFRDLLDVVKDTKTTLDFRTATTAALQLKAVGIEGERATQVIKQLGIAATLSGSSSDDVGEVARQLTQAASKGRILQQELRIILERIPALAGVMKDEFGVVTADALRDAGVSAEEFINRLTRAIGENERFQSVQGGLSKSFETFGIELQIAGAELGETIAKSVNLQENLGKLSNFISRVVAGFSGLSDGTKKAIVFFTGAVTVLGPLVLGIGALTKAILAAKAGVIIFGGALKTLFLNPVGLTIAAIAALTYAFVKLYNTSAKFRAFLAGLGAVIKKFGRDIVNSITAPFKAINAALNGEFREAARLLRGEGKTAGETYAEAFNSSLSQSVDANISSIFEKARQRGGGGSSATNFESLFPSGFGSVASVGGGGASIPDRSPVSTVGLIQTRDLIDQVNSRTVEYTNTLGIAKRSLEDVGIANVKLNEGLSATTENLLAKLDPLRAGFVALAESIADLAIEGALSFKNFAAAAIDAIGQVIGALIQKAVAGVIANTASSTSFLGLAAIPIAAAAGRAASGIFTNLVKNIPGLAQGGIVPPGFPNDTFPAMLSSNEAVIPLDRLDGLLGGGGQVEFIISGNVLRGILRRAESAAYRTI